MFSLTEVLNSVDIKIVASKNIAQRPVLIISNFIVEYYLDDVCMSRSK